MDRDSISFIASVITAICTFIIVPLMTWVLLTTVTQGERIVSLESWRGEGRRYTSDDAEKDFGVVLNLIEQNKSRIAENTQSIKEITRKP